MQPVDPDLKTAVAVTNDVAAVSSLIAATTKPDSWLHKLAVTLPGLSILGLDAFRSVNAGEPEQAQAATIAKDSALASQVLAQFAPAGTVAHNIADLFPGLAGIGLDAFRSQ
jgi:hypothetical protein